MGETRVRRSKKGKANSGTSGPEYDAESTLERMNLNCGTSKSPQVPRIDTSSVATDDKTNFAHIGVHTSASTGDIVQYQNISYIEVKSTQEKGLAVFATRKISPGTLILADTPLIRLTQAEEDADKDSDTTRNKTALTASSALEAYFDALPKSTQKTYMALFDSHKSTYTRVKSIYYSNCYNLSGINKSSRTSLGGSCIGATASRINHSCIPNVQFSFDETSQLMLFHAIRPIPKGKEVLSNYDSIIEPRGSRRTKQVLYYGFECDCDACRGETEFWAKSDERRKAIIDAKNEIKECERAYNKLQHKGESHSVEETNIHTDTKGKGKGKAKVQDHDADMSSTPNSETKSGVPVQDPTPALARLEAMLVKEGLVGLSLANCYRTTAKWAERMNDSIALGIARQKEYDVCRICMGESAPRTLSVREKLVQLGLSLNREGREG